MLSLCVECSVSALVHCMHARATQATSAAIIQLPQGAVPRPPQYTLLHSHGQQTVNSPVHRYNNTLVLQWGPYFCLMQYLPLAAFLYPAHIHEIGFCLFCCNVLVFRLVRQFSF